MKYIVAIILASLASANISLAMQKEDIEENWEMIGQSNTQNLSPAAKKQNAIEQGKKFVLSWFSGLSAPKNTVNFNTLPAEIKLIILDFARENIFKNIIVKNDFEQTKKNLFSFASTSRAFHTFINTPENMIWLVQLMEDAFGPTLKIDNFDIAYGLQEMPGIKNKTFKAWLKKEAPIKNNKERVLKLIKDFKPKKVLFLIENGLTLSPQERGEILVGIFLYSITITPETRNLIKALINAETDLNTKVASYLDLTPLQAATRSLDLQTVQLLVNAGANVNMQRKESKDTALIMAAMGKEQEKERAYITHILIGAKADVNLQDQQRYTALMYASGNGLKDVVKMLIDAGADLNTGNNFDYDRTALLYSIQNDHKDIARMLINAGANIDRALNYIGERKGWEDIIQLIKQKMKQQGNK